MGTFSKQQRYDVGALTNGLISGLVSITGVCDRCEPWSALIIGLLASLIYSLACKLVQKVGVDDPIEASMVHGFCGVWGLIAVGIFDTKHGLVSDSSDSWQYLGVQCLGILIIIVWVSLFALPYFLLMRRLNLLRVPLIFEIIGLDIAEMGSKVVIDEQIAASIYREHQLKVSGKRFRDLRQEIKYAGKPKKQLDQLPKKVQ